ncbi:glutamine amidotransferase subunit DUG2 [Lachancea thermotolerans CBS 6340]|uniref:KLTH0H11000p n=1 Tax=Lachancea thermotolerans (strain ATCC 56472 / CBS 6340 / NRRL Y-8284) TaxID=559295 RepID=C5E377_LACTC|nr:KLTH0H11000p [Lachancea thermotolerans CBS 6340]CAR30488.1 KLTH0H11000p [Lachancea thermotolerans CBS 6340]
MPPSIHKWNHQYAILSTVAFPHKRILFAGTHDSKILCFDLTTYNLAKTICLGDTEETHTRSSVLCMTKSQDERFLFSAGADSLVRIWSVDSLTASGNITITEVGTLYSLLDIGDIFSLKYLDAHQTIVFGCQNANMLYLPHVMDSVNRKTQAEDLNKLPHRRFDRFFDSTGPGVRPIVANATPPPEPEELEHVIIEIPPEYIIPYAHNSFIYSTQPLKGQNGNLPTHFYTDGMTKENTDFIVSGGGDGMSKIWALSQEAGGYMKPRLITEMNNEESVLCQIVSFPFLYCGLSDGLIKMWDLNTKELVSTFQAPSKCDIVSISVYKDHIFATHQKGVTKFYRDEVYQWNAHQGLVLSAELLRRKCTGYSHLRLATGGNDGALTLWNVNRLVGEEDENEINNISSASAYVSSHIDIKSREKYNAQLVDHDNMFETLRELISFKTVSALTDTQYVIDLRRCASFLQELFTKLGAACTLLTIKNGCSPLIHAQFHGKAQKKKKILWYGHYDIISPGDPSRWKTDPFTLTCENGYLKGRGVTDNKGPLVAAMYSVGSAFLKGELLNDVVFLIEGQEESSSQGFAETINKHRDLIGNDVDWVLFSNSYWVDDKVPCLNYGLRGVINARITVWNNEPDKHSGFDGGTDREPTADLISVTSKLQDDDGRVLIPGFYEPLKQLSAEEEIHFKEILKRTNVCKSISLEKLRAKWTKPSLSVTNMKVSGPGNVTVIPSSASVTVSIRIVPEQDVADIKNSLEQYVNECFKKLKTNNKLTLETLNTAEPWLGDPKNSAYQVLREEIQEAWGADPLLVREGGSIPQIRFLERVLRAPAVQVPCGQSTDNAHLDNERLRIENWYKMRQILHKAFNRL